MNISLKTLQKVRCRLLDRKSARPIAGVIVNLSVALDGDKKSCVPVSTLRSDTTGYLSFDLTPLIKLGLDQVQGILLSAPRIGLKGSDLLAMLPASDPSIEDPGDTTQRDSTVQYLLEKHGAKAQLENITSPNSPQSNHICIEFPIYVDEPAPDSETSGCGCRLAKIPSIQRPDVCDYELSPYSFVTPLKSTLGGDCCESMVPATLPVYEHSFYKVVVRRSLTPQNSVGFPFGSVLPLVDVTSALTAPSPTLKFADVLDYRQRWYAIGHSLGEIKYSLPLGPGESTQLAVIEWSREDTASRYDDVRGTEFLQHELRRDRSIDESVNAGLSESQGGWSWQGGLSSGMAYNGAGGQYGDYTGNWSAGGATSNSSGNRKLKADSLQDLHDSVSQGTTYVRSLTSTVIVRASQAEQNAIQTRRVANHNHCHSLTIQYYEVLRHFRLQTEFVGRRNAVLISFAPFRFTRELALRFQTVLELALLNETLSPCFDAMGRLSAGDSAYTSSDDATKGTTQADAQDNKYFSGTVPAPLIVAADSVYDSGMLIEKGSKVTVSAEGQGIKFKRGDIGDGYGPQGGDQIAQAPYPVVGTVEYALLAKVGGDFYEVRTGATFTAANEGQLMFQFNDWKLDDNSGFARVQVSVTRPTEAKDAPAPKNPTPETPKASKEGDQLSEQILLNHLNGNQGYYNRAVWMLMDRSERRLYLEMALGSNSDLLSGIDDIPLSVSGGLVAFPYDGPVPQSISDQEADPDPIESIVTLPTRGLFAEAQLGHCNSCEKRDITRMWDWTEMTAEEPPPISGIQPGPQGQMPNLTSSQLPSNVVQITQPPAAPDPTGLADALKVLGTPNIFRDMSGLNEASALLGKLVDGTNKTLDEMVQMAGQAKAKVDAEKAKAEQSNAANAKNGNAQKQTPTQRYDNLQVAKEVASAADALGIDNQGKQDLMKSILGDGNQAQGNQSQDPAGEGASSPLQLVSGAAEIAIDLGADAVKKVIDAAFKDKNLSMDLLRDGAILVRGYPDPDDYVAPFSGSIYDEQRMYLNFENVGGGVALDGLYATYEITWNDHYTLDPDKLKPEHKANKPYLPWLWCKQNILITPGGRTGQAITSATIKLDLVANKLPTPRRSGQSQILNGVEIEGTLLVSLSVQSNFGAGTMVQTLRIPINQRFGGSNSTIRVVNDSNASGVKVIYPNIPDPVLSVTL